MLKKKELDQIEDYIENVRWKYASTMPKYPHEYTVKEWNPEEEETFEMFVRYIRAYGYKEFFFRKLQTYLDIGEYTYWTMGAPIEETIIINRKEKG